MNGAESLLETLCQSGIEVCFANPGTSEMQLVAAIGRDPRLRAVLCLFEGVASGAADGYARMRDRPALTLLHLGSGFANSMANQHNAMRARVPLVNLVGDHASYHLQFDAPLTSDIAAHAAIPSAWVRRSQSADDLAQAGAEAVQAALSGSGHVATLIAPADHAWSPAREAAAPLAPNPPRRVAEAAIDAAVDRLGSGQSPALFLGAKALREPALFAAGRIAAATGARLLCETFPARLQRGTGRVMVERLPYFAEQASAVLAGLDQLLLVGAQPPVSFFAYPGKASWLAPDGCSLATLATPEEDILAALTALADRLNAPPPALVRPPAAGVPPPAGTLTPLAIGQSLAALLPRDAIVSDEANTCGIGIFAATGAAAPHDWLTLTGGAIGQGLPLALGASIACPDRKVVALEADGSAMYTLQALWTMARENADVTVVILDNRSYAILNLELNRVGAGRPTPATLSLLDLSRPAIDWVALSLSLGIPAVRATSAEEFHAEFAAAMGARGPRLIDALVVQELPGV